MNRQGTFSRRPFWRTPKFWIDNAHAVLALSTYLLLLLSRVIDTTILSRDNEYLSIVMLQVMIFLIPGVIFCKLRGSTFTERLRLRLPRPSHILLLIAALIGLISGTLLISIYTGGIETLDQGFTLYDTFSAGGGSDLSEVLYLILAYAVLPAVCEEFVYRGILCASLEERGLLPAIVYSAVSFGMLHFELSHLPVYIFAGLLLCAVMYATRSLLSTVIVHFAFNLFGLFGQPALTQFYLYTGSTELFTFLLVVIFLLSAILFCGEAGRIYRGYARTAQSAPYRVDLPKSEWPRRLLHTVFAPVSIVCMVVYLLACLFI
jgi:membrane protease YdiL (CAAX protease family)